MEGGKLVGVTLRVDREESCLLSPWEQAVVALSSAVTACFL